MVKLKHDPYLFGEDSPCFPNHEPQRIKWSGNTMQECGINGVMSALKKYCQLKKRGAGYRKRKQI